MLFPLNNKHGVSGQFIRLLHLSVHNNESISEHVPCTMYLINCKFCWLPWTWVCLIKFGIISEHFNTFKHTIHHHMNKFKVVGYIMLLDNIWMRSKVKHIMAQSKLSCCVVTSYKLWTTPEVKQMARKWSYDNSCHVMWFMDLWVHKFDNFKNIWIYVIYFQMQAIWF